MAFREDYHFEGLAELPNQVRNAPGGQRIAATRVKEEADLVYVSDPIEVVGEVVQHLGMDSSLEPLTVSSDVHKETRSSGMLKASVDVESVAPHRELLPVWLTTKLTCGDGSKRNPRPVQRFVRFF